MVTNLLNNSIKFTPAGGSVELDVSLLRSVEALPPTLAAATAAAASRALQTSMSVSFSASAAAPPVFPTVLSANQCCRFRQPCSLSRYD